MASVILYHSTGYDPVNLPYDEDALNKAASSKTEAVTLDLCQLFMLPSVRVKAFEKDVMDVDYIKLYDTSETFGNRTAFYVVTGYTMVAPDTAALSIVPDPGLTVGGWATITPKAGTVLRSYDLTEGDLTVDPFLKVTEQPQSKYQQDGFGLIHGEDWAGDSIFVASTIQLDKVPLPDVSSMDTSMAGIYKIASGKEQDTTIVYPDFIPSPSASDDDHITHVEIQCDSTDVTGYIPDVIKAGYNIEGYAIYVLHSWEGYLPKVYQEIQMLRAYGMESAILGAWRVPNVFINQDESVIDHETGLVKRLVSKSIALDRPTWDSTNPYETMSPSALYSDENKKKLAELLDHSIDYRIGLMSMSTGARMEKRRVEVSGRVFAIADPRMNGGPYFVLPNKNMSATNVVNDDQGKTDLMGLLQSCAIQGATWVKVPIMYQGSSGYAKNWDKYNLAVQQNNERWTISSIGNAVGLFASAAGGYISPSYGDPVETINHYRPFISPNKVDFNDVHQFRAWQLHPEYYRSRTEFDTVTPVTLDIDGGGLAGNIASYGLRQASIDMQRDQANARERQNFQLNNTMVPPAVVSQPIEGIENYFGNYSIVYATYPTEKDLDRFGTIAAMFGVACYRPVSSSDFKKRPKCFYVQASGVTLGVPGRRIPKVIQNDLVSLIAGGVRVWSGQPSILHSADWAARDGGEE